MSGPCVDTSRTPHPPTQAGPCVFAVPSASITTSTGASQEHPASDFPVRRPGGPEPEFLWRQVTPGDLTSDPHPSAGPVVKEMTGLNSELRDPILSNFIFTLIPLPALPPSPFLFFFLNPMQPLKEWWSFSRWWPNHYLIKVRPFVGF